MTTLNSEIILCKGIRMDKQYVNVLSYKQSKMLELCRSNTHLVASKDDYSFIRNTGGIKTSFTYNQCLQANYIAFQNKDYSNKWFFAFIDEVIFRGENNTEIRYTVDAWSTWYDNWTKKNCFINRQHVLNDTIGSNLVDENLNVGEVIERSSTETTELGTEWCVAIESTYNPDTKQDYTGSYVQQGTPRAVPIFVIPRVEWEGSTFFPINKLENFLNYVNTKNKIESIINIYIIPQSLVTLGIHYNAGEGANAFDFYSLEANQDTPPAISKSITKNTSFDDFTPKNMKVYTYPYNYLEVTNNIGNINIYKYENFSTNNMQFDIEGVICCGCSIRLVPKNYKGSTKNYDEIVPLAKYPPCAWTNDAYTNWLTQNAVNIQSQFLSLGASTVGSVANIAMGNVAGGITGGLSVAQQTLGIIGEFRKADMLSNVQHGENSGDVNFAFRKNTFTFKKMSAKTEYLKIIDDYFTRFGYAIKKIDNPHLTGRRNWNYIEIGSNENIGYGDVPSSYMTEINNACRKGVTIWHNHENLGDYSLDNSIN